MAFDGYILNGHGYNELVISGVCFHCIGCVRLIIIASIRVDLLWIFSKLEKLFTFFAGFWVPQSLEVLNFFLLFVVHLVIEEVFFDIADHFTVILCLVLRGGRQ